jgi:hypothetical protein
MYYNHAGFHGYPHSIHAPVEAQAMVIESRDPPSLKRASNYALQRIAGKVGSQPPMVRAIEIKCLRCPAALPATAERGR